MFTKCQNGQELSYTGSGERKFRKEDRSCSLVSVTLQRFALNKATAYDTAKRFTKGIMKAQNEVFLIRAFSGIRFVDNGTFSSLSVLIITLFVIFTSP